MGSKYDNLKHLMSEDDSPLPPELKWEQMEAGIVQKMDKLQATQPSSSKRDTLTRIGVVTILLLLLGIPSLCSRIEKDTTPAVSHQQAKVEHDGLPEEDHQNASPSRIASSPDYLERTPSAADLTQQKGTRSTLPVDRSQQLTHLSKTVHPRNAEGHANRTQTQARAQTEFAVGDPSASSFVTASSMLEGEHSPLPGKPDLPIREPKTQPLVNNEIENSASIGQKDALLSIPVALLPVKEMGVIKEPEAISLPPIQKVSTHETAPKQAGAPASRITFMSGLSWWTMGNGATKPERHPYERTIASYQARLDYLYTFKKNFTLMAGVQVHQLNSRFDWSGELDDYTLTLTDTIVQIQTNSLTRQQSEIRGDVEVNVPALRSVRHFNQTRLYQLSLALGKTWTVKNWQADVLLGGNLNLLSENSGRTLYLGEIQDYNGAATDFLAPQWKLHGLFMGQLSYQISNRFSIATGVQFQKSLTNWSTEPNVEIRPNLLSWELGMSYLLN